MVRLKPNPWTYLGPWTLDLQCFDTVGWVIRPVKPVLDMTYKVFGGTLNFTLSICPSLSHFAVYWRILCECTYTDKDSICKFRDRWLFVEDGSDFIAQTCELMVFKTPLLCIVFRVIMHVVAVICVLSVP